VEGYVEDKHEGRWSWGFYGKEEKN